MHNHTQTYTAIHSHTQSCTIIHKHAYLHGVNTVSQARAQQPEGEIELASAFELGITLSPGYDPGTVCLFAFFKLLIYLLFAYLFIYS